jgi:hypothetical protein
MTGSTMAEKPIRKLNRPIAERFWGHVDIRSARECWQWLSSTTRKGYGQFQTAARANDGAHRVAYELEHGPIPLSYQVHHTCHNKLCCNPRHLEAISAREHTLGGNGFAGVNARKTHCKRGHELTPENCYDYAGKRACKLCARIRAREQQRRIREQKRK